MNEDLSAYVRRVKKENGIAAPTVKVSLANAAHNVADPAGSKALAFQKYLPSRPKTPECAD